MKKWILSASLGVMLSMSVGNAFAATGDWEVLDVQDAPVNDSTPDGTVSPDDTAAR